MREYNPSTTVPVRIDTQKRDKQENEKSPLKELSQDIEPLMSYTMASLVYDDESKAPVIISSSFNTLLKGAIRCIDLFYANDAVDISRELQEQLTWTADWYASV